MTPTAAVLLTALGLLALAGALGFGATQDGAPEEPRMPQGEVAIPTTHHGAWSGPNRLWMFDPDTPDRGDGTLEVAATTVRYTWTRGEKTHQGELDLAGQPEALRGEWTDDFHAAKGMTLHGFQREGVVHLYGTYPAGQGQPDWGWQIELDARDREAFTLRMFNVVPGEGPMPAVVLHGTR
jgi:hypothetical protein